MIKKAFAVVATLLLAAAPLFAVTPTPGQIDRFFNGIKQALEDKDLSAVISLTCTDGVPQEFVDIFVSFWEQGAARAAIVTYEKLEFIPFKECLVRPDMNQKEVREKAYPLTMNGHVYIRNPPVIGFVNVKFTPKARMEEGGMAMGTFHTLQPVGFDNGELKFSLLRRKTNSEAKLPTPVPLPSISIKAPSDAAVKAFISAVSKAWKSGDPKHYKMCVASDGVSEALMDGLVYTWETDSVADFQKGRKIFESAKFASVAELENKREGMPGPLSVETVVFNGNTYGYNLPLVGAVIIRSTEDKNAGRSGSSYPVGIDPQGNLKIASRVRVAK